MYVAIEFWIDHFTEYYVTYIALLACVLPILYLTKAYSIPAMMYALELAIYFALMHVVVWGIVRVAFWFRQESTMRALSEDGPDPSEAWRTPLLEFWQTEAYNPSWLLYVEAAFAIIILYLVIRYRPMKVQYKTKRQKMRERNEKQIRNRVNNYSEEDF